MLGCLVFSDPRDPKTETLGLLLLFGLGAGVFPYLYVQLVGALGATGWAMGLVTGIALGALVAAALPWLGSVSPCVRSGRLIPPGRFGLSWGRATPAAVVAGAAVYGVVLALVLAQFAPPAVA